MQTRKGGGPANWPEICFASSCLPVQGRAKDSTGFPKLEIGPHPLRKLVDCRGPMR